MGIRNAIRQSSMPTPDDLEGWKARVKYLENELKLALNQVDDLETAKEDSDPGLPEVAEGDDDAAA